MVRGRLIRMIDVIEEGVGRVGQMGHLGVVVGRLILGSNVVG